MRDVEVFLPHTHTRRLSRFVCGYQPTTTTTTPKKRSYALCPGWTRTPTDRHKTHLPIASNQTSPFFSQSLSSTYPEPLTRQPRSPFLLLIVSSSKSSLEPLYRPKPTNYPTADADTIRSCRPPLWHPALTSEPVHSPLPHCRKQR